MEYALLRGEDHPDAETLFEDARERLAGMDVETRAYGGGSPARPARRRTRGWLPPPLLVESPVATMSAPDGTGEAISSVTYVAPHWGL